MLSGPVLNSTAPLPVMRMENWSDRSMEMVLKTSRAMPRESNPGPMLAVVAGARTVILLSDSLIAVGYFNPSPVPWKRRHVVDSADTVACALLKLGAEAFDPVHIEG